MANEKLSSDLGLFKGLRQVRDVTGYTLFRGTTDWSQLKQFDLFETGYPYLIMVSYPEFLKKMAIRNNNVKTLIDSYNHIIEYEFLGLDSGIDDISTDALTISNNLQEINVIGKVTAPGSTNFSMTYYERAGGTLSKMHELYLRSVRDPASGFKTYNGLIGPSNGSLSGDDTSPGYDYSPNNISFDKETWSFLYMHTDPTGLALEQAIYFIGCWPTSANISQYTNAKRGDINFSEVTVEFTGFPLRGKDINERAKAVLDYMNTRADNLRVQRNSWDYEYDAITDTSKLNNPALVGENTL